MCGILGGIGHGSSEAVNKYIDLLNRRGPDNRAIRTLGNGLTLGSTRLAMTDPFPRSNQPMVEPSTGNMIVFNGEIYNYKTIRKDLSNAGVKFDTESDTEVLLKAISFMGPNVISTLEGMFSFVFFDKNCNSLIMARDFLGKKPLYYFLGENKFFFASHVEVINKYKKGLKLNLGSVKTYLELGYLVDPETMFENIVSVMPGEIISVDLNNLSIKSSDKFMPESMQNSGGLSLSDTVESALAERVDGHDKFAISLSGGIDSSILALECSKLGFSAETYSMAWSNSDKDRYQSDSQAAKQIAHILGLKHRTIQMPAPDKLDSILSEYVRAMGEPNSNPSGISMMILYSEIAKDKHRLVLTGDGADEVFGGYERYKMANQLKYFPKINSQVIKKTMERDEFKNKVFKGLLLSSVPHDSDFFWLYWHSIARENTIKKIIKELPDSKPQIYGDELNNLYASNKTGAAQLMFRDLMTWLPMESNRKLDRVSMWYSIEARSPFQSEKVIGNGYRKMSDLNFSKVNKEILKNAFPDVYKLPILKSKHGFISPLGFWLRENPGLIEDSLTNITNYLPFERSELLLLSKSAKEYSFTRFKVLWSLIVLNRWLVINT
jgi:asparagine synthase (glutamine-hydrolysing)